MDTIAARQVALYRREIPAYAAIGDDDLHSGAIQVLRAVLARLTELRSAEPASLEAVEQLGRRRAEQGFPLEALTRAFQLGAHDLLLAVDEEAAAAGMEPRLLLAVHDLTWTWANDAAAVVAAIDREMQVALVRRDAARRSDYLPGVLQGRLSSERCLRDAHLFGLKPDQPYYALRARPSHSGEEAELTRAVVRSGSTSARRPVLAVVDGDLVGLTPAKPRFDDPWLLAVAPAASLTQAAAAFDRASDAMLTALEFGLTGVIELADLGPLPLALGAQTTAAELEQRHFSALDGQERVGREIELTVRTMLELDQDVGATSTTMHIHRNTVRYRLTRFRELTGLDLRHTPDFVTTWWLLHRRAARQRRRLDG